MTTNPGFLEIMAYGDAFGMKYEFVEHEQNKTAADLTMGRHPKFEEYQQGMYTDDTQMSLGTLELMTEKGADALNPDALIWQWLKAFKRDPRVGYSQRMYDILTEAKNPDEFRAMLDPTRGHTSGAAMRAGPLGLLNDIDQVKKLTEMQARITHNTTTGVNSALAVALSVYYLHHGGELKNLSGFLDAQIGKGWNSAENGFTPETGNGLNIVTQALKAVQGASSYSDLLLSVVNNDAKSDTDTVCAIAMLIASRSPEIKNDLPAALVNGLENNRYGADYLELTDMKALKAFPATRYFSTEAILKRSPWGPNWHPT